MIKKNMDSKIKLILFDLDGVLVTTKKLHYETLNEAIATVDEKCIIKWDEHLRVYDGLKTTEKLKMLTKNKNFPIDKQEEVWGLKQKFTLKALSNLSPDKDLVSTIKSLSERGFKLGCCSNSIRRSVLTILSKLGLIEYMDVVLSNEDVKNGKPHPEMYWKAMSILGVLPEETIIIEDSPHGLLAASRSKAKVIRVKNPKEVTLNKILKEMNIETHIPKWKDDNLNVLIPMAGAGSRFEKAGYTFPKPLIEVKGKPMIQVVVENLNVEANFIYIVQKTHREKYNLDTLLNLITPNCKIVEVDGMTEGAACTTLLAKDFIDNNKPLLMANSDQFIEWNSNEFLYKMNEGNPDGGILSFTATHPKWSFAKTDNYGLVTEVVEKNPISNIATVGVYYWKKGSDYVKYAEQMIKNDIRTNNEFYVCPVFNEAIKDKKKIRTHHIDRMWGLGTPEDLKYYIDNYK